VARLRLDDETKICVALIELFPLLPSHPAQTTNDRPDRSKFLEHLVRQTFRLEQLLQNGPVSVGCCCCCSAMLFHYGGCCGSATSI